MEEPQRSSNKAALIKWDPELYEIRRPWSPLYAYHGTEHPNSDLLRELSITFASVANDSNTDTTTIKVMIGERTDSTEATRTKIDCMGCGFRELGCLRPIKLKM